MILAEVKRYMIQRKQATLADIAQHCGAEPDAVRGMLEQWIRKGKVEKQMANSACGSGCSQCDTATVEIYTWLHSEPDSQLEKQKNKCPTRTGRNS